MSRYGINYYNLATYGQATSVSFNATPFTAKPYGYGQIYLTWIDPTGRWSDLRIIRNTYGYPVNAYDGIEVLTVQKGSDPTFYIDSSGIKEGGFYYYSIFVYDVAGQVWSRAGDAIGLSVKSWGNKDKLYDYIPEIYKLSALYSMTDTNVNEDLVSFLNLFGFQLDIFQTLTDLIIKRYDVQKLSGVLLPPLMNQFGLDYEPTIGYQQGRILLRDAVQLNKEKGTSQGLREFIKSYCGWAVPSISATAPNKTINGIVKSHNLMLDYNDSSFEEGYGHWTSTDSTATISQLKILKITSVSLTSNVARLYIGKHMYEIGDQLTISGLPYPLFNTAVPVTLTGVDKVNGWVQYSLTATDIALTTGYNIDTKTYGLATPTPSPWIEPTSLGLYPNKSMGVGSIYNSNGTTATVNAICGGDDPINKGIPVTVGNTYTFSVYASKGSYTARTVTATIKWFDRFGVALSTSTGTGVSATVTTFGSSVRPFVTAAAPAGAYYACPGISIASLPSNNHHYFDGAQFELANSATSFDDARQLHITLRANRINELKNPNFASPFSPWSASGTTLATDIVSIKPGSIVYSVTNAVLSSNVVTLTTSKVHPYITGSTVYVAGISAVYNGYYTVTAATDYTFSYAKTNANVSAATVNGTVYKAGEALALTALGSSASLMSKTTNADMMPIYYPQTSYTFSIYVRDDSSTESVTASIVWCDLTYAVISTASGSAISLTNNWKRTYVTSTAPSNAAYAYVKLDWTVSTNNIIYIDQALFENSPFVLDYFDGSNGPAEASDILWEGNTPNAGRSHFYKNRVSVQTRLATAIQEYVPMGTTYAIYLAQPKT